MPFSPHYRAEVEAKLGAEVEIESKVMFGGVAIYSDGLLFAVIDDDRLYLKADESTKDRFEDLGMGPLYYAPGKPPMAYWELPAGVIDEPSGLKEWIALSIAVARAKKAKSKPKRSKAK